jgi:hypothetical protein
LVNGILHQGCKMILAGTSKTNKSWCLIDLALSVACGAPWWGQPTTKANVLYLNLELPTWAFNRRLDALEKARPELTSCGDTFHSWQLRGRQWDMSILKPRLQRYLDRNDLGLIVVDPIYKLLGDRDENSNTEITELLTEMERLAEDTDAAVVLAHHFAKGDPAVKDPIDRMSGAGAWGRDPDCILVLTPHEEPNCFTVSSILRNLPALPEFVVHWAYPRMVPAIDLDPQSLRRRQGRKKILTDRDFIESVLSGVPQSFAAVEKRAAAVGMSRATAARFCQRLLAAGLIKRGNGLYWVPDPGVSGGASPRIAETTQT